MKNAQMTYTSGNRLGTYNGEPIEYDADGNMLTGPLHGKMSAFTYDSRNRLTSGANKPTEGRSIANRGTFHLLAQPDTKRCQGKMVSGDGVIDSIDFMTRGFSVISCTFITI